MPQPQIRVLSYRDKKTVTVLPIEDYLKFVVPVEMPAEWPVEALRAQTIACRSYAWYACHRPRHSLAGADVCDSPRHCQLFYPGKSSSITDKIISSTVGLICTYNGKVAEAMYHKSCGGRTVENFSPRQPYLRGVSCSCGLPREGHGVGMCQYGAKEMAEAGASYVQILQHYYADISIEPLWFV